MLRPYLLLKIIDKRTRRLLVGKFQGLDRESSGIASGLLQAVALLKRLSLRIGLLDGGMTSVGLLPERSHSIVQTDEWPSSVKDAATIREYEILGRICEVSEKAVEVADTDAR